MMFMRLSCSVSMLNTRERRKSTFNNPSLFDVLLELRQTQKNKKLWKNFENYSRFMFRLAFQEVSIGFNIFIIRTTSE